MEKTVCIVILLLYGIVMLMMCCINIFPKKNNTKNNVHFYVARDENGLLWLYLCKPIRSGRTFKTIPRGSIIESQIHFHKYVLNVNDYTNLKWEDEPVEVFLNLE